MTRPLELTLLLVGYAALAALILPFWGDWTGIVDFRHTTVLPASARHTILEYGQLPFWIPYVRGGFSHIGAMEGGTMFPTFLFVLGFDVFIAALLDYVLFAATGALGVALLARHVGASTAASVAAGAAFVVSNTMPVYLVSGWFMHFGVAWTALGVWLWLRAQASDRKARLATLGLAVLLCLMFLRGGMYPLVFLVLCIGLLAVLDVITQRSWKPIARLGFVGVTALLLGGVKLFSVMSLGDPVVDRGAEGFCFTPTGVLVALSEWTLPGSLFEGCGTVGPVMLSFAVLGAVFAWRRVRGILALVVMLTLLALGSHLLPGSWSGPMAMHECGPGASLADLLRQLPLLEAFWNPSRALAPAGMLLLIPAALGLDQLRHWIARPSSPIGPQGAVWLVAALVAALVVLPGFRSARAYLSGTMTPLSWGGPPETPTPFAQHRQCALDTSPPSHRLTDAACPRFEWGTVHETNLAFHPPAPALRVVEQPDYLGEVYWLGSGSVSTVAWSPNRLEYALSGHGPGHLLVNQNHRPGWVARGDAAPSEVKPLHGLLSVQAHAPGTVILEYAPAAPWWGLGATLLGLMIIGVGAWSSRSRARR